MWLQYFGFQEDPFGVSPDPRYLYPSQTHQEALESPMPSRAEVIRAVAIGEKRAASMPLIAGCCYDAIASTRTYDGYDASFRWRLEEAVPFA